MNIVWRCGVAALVGAILTAAPAPAIAAIGEVTGVRFDTPTTIAWDPDSSAVAFNIHRGVLAGLPDNASCILGSVPGPSVPVPASPSPGVAWYFLVSAYDEFGEGTLGTDSAGTPRVASTSCKPARRMFGLTTNGPAADGVEDGAAPRRNPNARIWSSSRESTGVYLHAGEFFLRSTDFDIPGRGMDLTLTRSYRSQISYDGPLGNGWDLGFNARLTALGADVVYHDGSGRRAVFRRDLMSPFFKTEFTEIDEPPRGLYAVLKENPDSSFTLRFPDGTLHHFHSLTGSGSVQGAIDTIEDRTGNVIYFPYDLNGLLTGVVDTLGRVTTLGYDDNGRITSVTDPAGRSWQYGYDTAGDLITARSPIVSMSPNGQEWPAGKTTTYGYDLAHNLTEVRAPREGPGGVPHIQNVYGAEDRIDSQTIGGTNASGVPAGGTLTYAYVQLAPLSTPDLVTPRRETTVTDRNGNESVHTHNYYGNAISIVERTNRGIRGSEGDYTTTHAYNEDGEITETTHPEGNRTQYVFPAKPAADRYREGNVLERRRIADLPRGGDGYGASSADIIFRATYEPIYNRRAIETDPRGNDPAYVPQNGGTQSAGRYTARWFYDYQESDPAVNGIDAYRAAWDISDVGLNANLGPLNHDGRTDLIGGDLVREVRPPVALDPASNQAAIEGDTSQDIVTTREWNDVGQELRRIDPERNVTTFDYHPEDDPDGDGVTTPPPPDRVLTQLPRGYLATETIDTVADPARNNGIGGPALGIRIDYLWNTCGAFLSSTDGRGVVTRNVTNELDQVVEIRRAAATSDQSGPDGDPASGRGEAGLEAFGYKIRYDYDANDNISAVHREDRGQDRGLGKSWVVTTYEHDILDIRVEAVQDVAPARFETARYRYDPNQNRTLTILPRANAQSQVFDERDLLYRATEGALTPETAGAIPAPTLLAPGDPTNYDLGSGPPSTMTYDHDANGSVAFVTDGRGNTTQQVFDGFDRHVETIDAMDHRTRRCLDPTDRVVRKVVRGPGSAGAIDACGGDSAFDAETVEFLHDEMQRVIGMDRRLYVDPTSPADPRLAEGPLVPGDGFVNHRYEYDRLSRTSFSTRDDAATMRFDHDGASRTVRASLPDDSVIDYVYDEAGNLVETVETEKDSTSSATQTFLATFLFDSLDRSTATIDNVGQTTRRVYDSLDAIIVETDARGPVQGATVERRSSPGTFVAINDHGNVARTDRDGLGRRTATERVLTSTGEGDGTLNPPVENPPNTFNLDGVVRHGWAWDVDCDGGYVCVTDDRGHETVYEFDNLDRVHRVTLPDDTQSSMTYDGAGNVTDRYDANGSHVHNTYDAADRKTRADVMVLAPGIAGTTLQTFEWDALHRLTGATDNNDPTDTSDDVTLDFVYDSLGRLVEHDQTISAQQGGAATGPDYHWTAHDLTRVVYPGGRIVDYTYDAAGRLLSVDDADASRPESVTFTYFGLERVRSMTRDNGVSTDLTAGYDEARRLTAVTHLDSAVITLAGYEYGYDRAGNRSFERHEHDPDQGELHGEVFGHDSLERLLTFVEGPVDAGGAAVGTPDDVIDWILDGAGNWPRLIRDGTTYAATPNNLNEYDDPQSGGTRVDDFMYDDFGDGVATVPADGRNHGHDKNGNLTLDDDGVTSDTYAYDAFGRLIAIDRGPARIATYVYDPLGRRVKRTVANRGGLNETVRYLYAARATATSGFTSGTMDEAGWLRPGHGRLPEAIAVLEEQDGAGTIARQAVNAALTARARRSPWFGTLWQVRTDGPLTTDYLLADVAGNTIAVTPGASDTVSERVTYDPYGKPTFKNAGSDALCRDPAMPANPPQACNTLPPNATFIAQSTVGNPELFGGLRYDPETSKRTNDLATDRGGLYVATDRFFNPDEGRYITKFVDAPLGSILEPGNVYSGERVGGTALVSSDSVGCQDQCAEDCLMTVVSGPIDATAESQNASYSDHDSDNDDGSGGFVPGGAPDDVDEECYYGCVLRECVYPTQVVLWVPPTGTDGGTVTTQSGGGKNSDDDDEATNIEQDSETGSEE